MDDDDDDNQNNNDKLGSKSKWKPVIVYTPGMTNPLRSGLPPKLPSYASTTSLWRGERLVLQQLVSKDEELNEIVCGLDWKLPPGRSRPIIDFSALFFDENFEYIGPVDWTCLGARGAKHSGDWCGLLGNKGAGARAREVVTINFKKLKGWIDDDLIGEDIEDIMEDVMELLKKLYRFVQIKRNNLIRKGKHNESKKQNVHKVQIKGLYETDQTGWKREDALKFKEEVNTFKESLELTVARIATNRPN